MKLGPGFPPTSISGEEVEREISDRVKDRMSIGVQWQVPSVVLRSSAADVSVAFPAFAAAAPFAPAALRFSIATTNRITPIRCLSALNPSLKATLDKVVTSHKIVLFMKGTKEFPQCGFSNTVVQILTSLNAPFETVNILENEALRQGLKEYSSWPTFPQLYIDGEFFGGCDITVEAYKSGELQEVVERTLCS